MWQEIIIILNLCGTVCDQMGIAPRNLTTQEEPQIAKDRKETFLATSDFFASSQMSNYRRRERVFKFFVWQIQSKKHHKRVVNGVNSFVRKPPKKVVFDKTRNPHLRSSAIQSPLKKLWHQVQIDIHSLLELKSGASFSLCLNILWICTSRRSCGILDCSCDNLHQRACCLHW